MLKKYEGEKQKQILVVIGAVALIMLILYLWNKVTGGDNQVSSQPPQIKITETENIERAYEKGYEQRAKNIEEKLNKLIREITNLKNENEYLKKEIRRKDEERRKSQQLIEQVLKKKAPVSQGSSSHPPETGGGFIPPPPPPKLPEGAEQRDKVQELRNLIGLINLKKEELPLKGKDVKEEKKENKDLVRIPGGSFVKAVLLSGVDAPAGGKAMGNPHPVILRITDRAILPNRYRADIKECFVVGSAYGDLSSERAYIRAETLSCMKEGGKAVSAKVKGFVTGEDGKVGLRGRVVTRQGQILARTLIAGFLEGVAKAFQYSSTNLLISPQGAVSTIDPEQTLNVGIASGAAESAKKLADFYMKLANQMFPVIEVNAGRRVEIVFLSEVKI